MDAFICTACGMQYAPSTAPQLHNLYRGAAIRSSRRTDLDNARGTGGGTLEFIPSIRARRDWCWDAAFLCHWPAGPHCVHPRRQHLVGLHCDAGCGDHHLDQGTGRPAGDRESHPHFYTTMVEWSRAFGGIPIHLHADDQHWIMRPDPSSKLWKGDTLNLPPEVTLIRCGGHFRGGTMLHWARGGGGHGILCSSDIATVTMDRKFLTFMRSYPNLIPLSPHQVAGIAAALEPFQFDAIYGHYFDRVIPTGAKSILQLLVKRYVAAISGAYDDK